MSKIYNTSPYYDLYNKAKGYVKLLALPERGAQTSDWNTLQSMLLDFIKDLGNSIYKDGNVVEGCSFRINGNEIIIESGKVYMEGLIHEIQGTTLTITGKGEEFIGVILHEEIITEEQDSEFYDPAVGSANYLHPGCHRVKQTAQFVANDPLSAVIATFIDGQVKSIVEDTPVVDTISEVLARRTFDESGNYVVSGFDMYDGKSYDPTLGILVNLNKGKAYVRGFEIQKPVGTSFRVRKSTDTKDMLNEPHVTRSDTNNYELINTPVHSVNRVSVTVTKTEQATRGQVTGGSDSLSQTSIVEVQSVISGATTYTPGYDYILKNNTIDWSPSGKEPAPGASYTVTYTYKSNLVEGTDYNVLQSSSSTSIVILNNSVVTGTEMLVDYKYYLARKDTISMDKTGAIVVTEGQPNMTLLCEAPIINDSSLLKIGTILCYPNSESIFIENTTIKVSTMERIQKTINRVSDLEYNMSVTNLDKEAIANEVITDLKGVLTDGFLNFNKADIEREDVSFTVDDSESLNLPFTEYLTDISVNTSSPSNAYASIGTNWCCPYTETMILTQPYGTDSMLVNPYQVFNPMMTMSITPEVDNWVDTKNVEVENVTTTKATIEKWWRHPNMDEDKVREYMNTMNIMGIDTSKFKPGNKYSSSLGGIFDTSTSRGKSNNYKVTATNQHITGTATKTISDKASLYMRQISIKAVSDTFEGLEEVRLDFAGKKVKLTPLAGCTQGSSEYSIKANAQGRIECSFTIPKKTPCGTVEVKMYSLSHADRVAITSFTAEGREQTVETTIYIQRNVVYAVDPLAQTFMLDYDCNITSVDLYFTAKDGTVPANVQIRGVTNGYPNTIVYSEKIVTGSNINASADGSVPTRVTFPNIVKCEANTQYCVVILTDSPKISLAVATLGAKDMISAKYVVSNPYSTGVLFSSSNASTWTAHQDKDLKFNLYRAEYAEAGAIIFNDITLNSIDRIMLAVDSIVPAGCIANFQVSLNNGEWYPYLPWVDYYLSLNAVTASLKVDLKSTGKQSPIISSITPRVYSTKNELTATYITKNIVLDTGFNSIKVYIDTAVKQGTSYDVYYALDTQGLVWNKMTITSQKPLTEDVTQNYYEKALDKAYTDYRVKVVLTTTKSYIRPYIKRLMNVLRDV